MESVPSDGRRIKESISNNTNRRGLIIEQQFLFLRLLNLNIQIGQVALNLPWENTFLRDVPRNMIPCFFGIWNKLISGYSKCFKNA